MEWALHEIGRNGLTDYEGSKQQNHHKDKSRLAHLQAAGNISCLP